MWKAYKSGLHPCNCSVLVELDADARLRLERPDTQCELAVVARDDPVSCTDRAVRFCVVRRVGRVGRFIFIFFTRGCRIF